MVHLHRRFIVVFVALSTAVCIAGDEPVEATVERAQQNLINFVAPQPDLQLTNFSVVKLRVVVAVDGKVANTTTINGDPGAAARVVEAVRQWQYKPFMQDGKPVAVAFEIDIPIGPQPSASGAGEMFRWAWSNRAKRYVDMALGKNHHEDWGMHACKSGYAMSAAEVDKDVLLCLQILTDPSSEESEVDGDPGIERDGAHACPVGWYMRGLHAPNPFDRGKNSLLCSRSSNVTLSVEKRDSRSLESPVCAWQDVDACPKSMQSCPNDAPVMTGIHLATWHGQSAFLCARTDNGGVRR